jgi:hypothetical protein
LILSHSEIIEIEYGNLQSILDWVERNIEGEWGWFVVEPGGDRAGVYKFYFEEDSDLTKFIMWLK